ncbi:MAG TPA: chromate transporter [Acetobacteraceae bacterium]|nr:chromate transporter [Acetobacteraceae bacterium]
MSPLVALGAIFGMLSLLAVGGVTAVLPELQRQVTEVHRWMAPTDFAALFALAQAAPGPNMMVATLVGWRVARLAGAAVATLAMIGPSSVLTYLTAGAWHRFRHAAWRGWVQAGVTPVTVGLVMAAAALLARSTAQGVGTAALTLATAALVLTTRLHPLLLLAAGAALGFAGLR